MKIILFGPARHLVGIAPVLGAFLALELAASDAECPAGPQPAIMHCRGPTLNLVTNLPAAREVASASGDFNIVPIFDATVSAAQRVVIQHAVDEWNALLQSHGINPGTWNVPIQYAGSNNVELANTGITFWAPNGDLQSASMAIFTNYNWYVDPNPADDVEFQENPPAGFDLLSVVRHELGHAVGWIASPRVTNLVSGNVFDATRLNIGMAPGDIQHADGSAHPGEVMQPAIEASTRRSIRLYPTVALVSRAYEYNIPMHFIDPGFGGTETGTAWQPWQTVSRASSQSPERPFLLSPTSHQVFRGQTFATPHRWEAARGGALVTAP